MEHKIEYSEWTFESDKIKSGNLHLASSLLSDSLEANSFSVVLECDDPSILNFERNTKLKYYVRPEQPMIFHVQDIKRVGPNFYNVSATSTLGLLIKSRHMGGIYTGQTVNEVISSICGTVPFIVKSNLKNMKLYGWLPIAASRDNLSQVLFAIGATLKTDLNGVLRIEGLWDGILDVISRGHIYTDATVDYDSKITQVVVSEHQYILWTEEKHLFDGIAQAGDIITFDEPMHDLTAEGFAILDSGANWAKVSAGSGVLSGKTYLHNIRQISKDVWPVHDPNIKTVKDATLVSLVNSQACAKRLADYYFCRERVSASVVYRGESPGDRTIVYNPFDKIDSAACIESADITLSGTLKARESILLGYVPPAIGESEYYDHVDVITADTTWVVPEGVASMRAVLVGAGQGGAPGGRGGEADQSSGTYNVTDSALTDVTEYFSGPALCYGGAGGEAGEGGRGGKILQVNVTVEPGQSIQVSIGKGGSGADYQHPLTEHNGGATIFGEYSSDNGADSPSGYIDPIHGITYGGTGEQGIKGGNGGGAGPDVNADVNGIPGENVGEFSAGADYDETVEEFGSYLVHNSSVAHERVWAFARGYGGPGFGGGAAHGQNGTDGGEGSASASGSSSRLYATAKGGAGGNGGNASAPSKETRPGFGGKGGNGGGGAGSGGFGVCVRGVPKRYSYSGTWSVAPYAGDSGTPGDGSRGGDGADGCVLIYYRVYKNVANGRFLTRDRQFFNDRLNRWEVV